MSKKKRDEKKANHERWLLTYSDLITLLMIFFIVLYSFSNIDKEKFRQVVYGLNKAMGSGGGYNLVGVDGQTQLSEDWIPANTNTVDTQEDLKLEKIKAVIDNYLKQLGLDGSVETKIEERGLILSLRDSLFFESGSADIKAEQSKKLVGIGKLLNQPIVSDSYLRVEGHTDNVPISTYKFKSNWELSVLRAVNVVELLISESGIKPERISATGYGEYRPRAGNDTEFSRSINRRVDILIMNTKFNEVENNKK